MSGHYESHVAEPAQGMQRPFPFEVNRWIKNRQDRMVIIRRWTEDFTVFTHCQCHDERPTPNYPQKFSSGYLVWTGVTPENRRKDGWLNKNRLCKCEHDTER